MYIVRPHSSVDDKVNLPSGSDCRVFGSSDLQILSSVAYKNRSYYYIWQHTHVSIRQHTSAYVSTRQHTSAYVSIRQHTSAYVSMRQHGMRPLSPTKIAHTTISENTRTRIVKMMRTALLLDSLRHSSTMKPHAGSSFLKPAFKQHF
jgi:hypothetical protein